jgi:exopolysaccharide production protein ExoZ
LGGDACSIAINAVEWHSKGIELQSKINNLQLLRAYAAIAVAAFHAGLRFPTSYAVGSFGVDVFFVISGYVMARICDSNSHFFLRRRLLRIVPPYWIATIALFIFTYYFPQLLTSTRADIVELIKSLLFIPFRKADGLLQPLLFIGWSVNYEMFFYVLLSLSLLAYRRYAVWLAGIAVVVIVVVCSHFANRSIFAEFYGRDISLEFVLGLLSYRLCRAIPERTAVRLRLPMLVAMIASAVGLVLCQGLVAHVEPRSVFFGGLSFILITSASLLSQGGWDTKAAWIVLIGDASYVLYLIHPYCEYFLSRVVSKKLPWLDFKGGAGILVSVALVVVVAVVLHVKLERPTVAFLNRKFGGKRKSAEFSPAKS